MSTVPFDLNARAHQAMLEAGFQPDFPPEVVAQARKPAVDSGTAARDLRSLLWSSIDNDSSRDLDQVEYVEQLPDGTLRLLMWMPPSPKARSRTCTRGRRRPRFIPVWPFSQCCRANCPRTGLRCWTRR